MVIAHIKKKINRSFTYRISNILDLQYRMIYWMTDGNICILQTIFRLQYLYKSISIIMKINI